MNNQPIYQHSRWIIAGILPDDVFPKTSWNIFLYYITWCSSMTGDNIHVMPHTPTRPPILQLFCGRISFVLWVSMYVCVYDTCSGIARTFAVAVPSYILPQEPPMVSVSSGVPRYVLVYMTTSVVRLLKIYMYEYMHTTACSICCVLLLTVSCCSLLVCTRTHNAREPQTNRLTYPGWKYAALFFPGNLRKSKAHSPAEPEKNGVPGTYDVRRYRYRV